MSQQEKYHVMIYCEECGDPKSVRSMGKATARFCSRSCASHFNNRLPSAAKGKLKLRKEKVRLECEHCGDSFLVTPYLSKGPRKRRFCSVRCMSRTMVNHPNRKKIYDSKERIEKIRDSNKRQFQTAAGELRRKALSERMKKNNPSHDPKVLAKAKQTKKERGSLHQWKGKRGGNGTFSKHQKVLWSWLDHDWQMELAIPTGVPKRNGYPTCYKVDIGNPLLKVAIEIDGPLHLNPKNKAKDQKKEELITSLGWRVLRFTNQEVDNNILKILRTISLYIV